MTLWKVTAGGVRLADELSRPVHPAAYALVTATPVALPIARTARSRVHALPRQRCLIRLRSDESAMPVVFGRTAVRPDTGHDLPPHRVIQGMDQLPQTRHPETVVPGKGRSGCCLAGRLPRTNVHRTNVNRQEKRAIALLLRQESRYRLRRARQTLSQGQMSAFGSCHCALSCDTRHASRACVSFS